MRRDRHFPVTVIAPMIVTMTAAGFAAGRVA
jgi:hypothetical protein